jgi:hypothetical protein
MTTLKIKAKLFNGHEREWNFTECHNENDYGNGNYIAADRGEAKYCIDVRYAKNYDFKQICIDEIKAFYGKNLVSYEVLK